MRISALSSLAVLLAAGSATAYHGSHHHSQLAARDAYLSARDAYAEAEEELILARDAYAYADPDESSSLFARSAYPDYDYEDLFGRDALPYDPSKPAGRNNRPAFAPGTFAADDAARKAKIKAGGSNIHPEQGGALPQKYKPHRPGTPNPNTGSFFSGADVAAAGRGPGSRYRREVMDWE